MWTSLTVLAILVVKATAYNSITSADVERRFREYVIVPRIIPEAPPYLLTIIFGPCKVILGTILPVCATTQEPLVSWPYPNDDILYTLVGFTTSGSLITNDTDLALSQLVVNARGENIQQGNSIVPFQPPNPPLGDGYRRTLWLVYRQVGLIEVTAALYTRFAFPKYTNFDINVFVKDFNLDLVAGNFFRGRRTLCDSTCCGIADNSCANSCGSLGCSSSLSTGLNSYESSCAW